MTVRMEESAVRRYAHVMSLVVEAESLNVKALSVVVSEASRETLMAMSDRMAAIAKELEEESGSTQE